MGKGKGSPEYWACRVKPGRIMFEVDGVPADVAHQGLKLAAVQITCSRHGLCSNQVSRELSGSGSDED